MMHSREQAAQKLGVSLPTLDALIGRGQLEKVPVGRRVFVTQRSLEDFIDNHAVRVGPNGSEESQSRPRSRRRATRRRSARLSQ